MNNQKRLRENMPSVSEIILHWIPILINDKWHLDYYYDELLTEDNCLKQGKVATKKKATVCFACSAKSNLQRCHILPLNQGGSNLVSNLHLLCSACHNESEILSGKPYDFWFYSKSYKNSAIFQERLRMVKLYAENYIKGNIEIIPIHVLNIIKEHEHLY